MLAFRNLVGIDVHAVPFAIPLAALPLGRIAVLAVLAFYIFIHSAVLLS
jgi:hypothetical protein